MKFLDPNDVLKQFGIYGTQDVADLGVGGGHFALAAARRLEGGRLYAVDLEREMLSHLMSEAERLGHKNIHPIWGDVAKRSGVPLADATLDRALATNILYQVDDRSGFVEEVKRLLRPGGKVLVIEWRHDAPGGPHQTHKVAPEVINSLFARHGFVKESDVDAGEYHYGMILVRGT